MKESVEHGARVWQPRSPGPVAGRLAARVAYPGGAGGRFNVLLFHRVLDRPDPLLPSVPDVTVFRRLMRAVREYFNVVPLREAVRRLRDGMLEPRTVSITFDDGYRDNLELAGPVLRELDIPATVFVATGFQTRPMMWNDCVIESIRHHRSARLDLEALDLEAVATDTVEERRSAIDSLIASLKHREPGERDHLVEALCGAAGYTPAPGLMLADEDLPRLADAHIEVGAHTVNHPILARLGIEQARAEMAQSKAALEQRLQCPVTLFAYPNGRPGEDYGPEHAQLAQEVGFEAAFSTVRGVVSRESDPYQMPRFSPWDHTPGRFLIKLLVHGLKPGLVS